MKNKQTKHSVIINISVRTSKKARVTSEDPVDNILSKLNVWDDESEQCYNYQRLIAKTILEIPKKHRKRILDNNKGPVFILMAGTTYALIREVIFTGKSNTKLHIKKKVILLNFYAMETRKKSKRFQMSSIAHEIAHFLLNHVDTQHSYALNAEKEADDLIEKWGFKRVYRRLPTA